MSIIVTLKQRRMRDLRDEILRYGHTAEAMENVGMHSVARYYRNAALNRCRQLEIIRDHRNSWQIRQDDKRIKRNMDELYPDAVELWT